MSSAIVIWTWSTYPRFQIGSESVFAKPSARRVCTGSLSRERSMRNTEGGSENARGRAGRADQRESRWQQPAVGQVVDGRQQFLAGEVTGHAEHDQHARLGDPGDSAITRIAERVSHPSAACSAPLILGSRCEPIVWRS